MNQIDPVEGQAGKIPILLLKTRSMPHDGYEEFLSGAKEGKPHLAFDPVFVPVLKHGFREEALNTVKKLLQQDQISKRYGAKYGGLIFTSQRAVEAFAKVVQEDGYKESASSEMGSCLGLEDVPIYTVGPATSRALKSIPQLPAENIFGSEMGNGEALAHYMLDHYGRWYAKHPAKPSLLFLVGEQRRDIIPKTLMNSALPEEKRISVDELVIYETGVMESFQQDFGKLLRETEDRETRWVVVFSPTGCEAMFRALQILDVKTGKVKTEERGGGCRNRVGKGRGSTYIATIGPTTRDYLRKTFGFEPDVCAGQPSPEGIQTAIEAFMQKNYDDQVENGWGI